MSKRKLAWIIVAIAGLLSAIGLFSAMSGTSKLVFTEADLQARLNQKLPKTVREVTIEHVVVGVADDRLALRVQMQGMVLRQPVSAVVSARGVPHYEARSGEMYFSADDVKIDQFTFAGRSVTREDAAARTRLTEAAGSAIQRFAESAIKAYLATLPVYRFKNDFKGFVLKAALVDVAIEQNALAVTFSLWNLTTTCAIFASLLAGILFLVYMLIRHPLWGLGTIAEIATTTIPS